MYTVLGVQKNKEKDKPKENTVKREPKKKKNQTTPTQKYFLIFRFYSYFVEKCLDGRMFSQKK